MSGGPNKFLRPSAVTHAHAVVSSNIAAQQLTGAIWWWMSTMHRSAFRYISSNHISLDFAHFTANLPSCITRQHHPDNRIQLHHSVMGPKSESAAQFICVSHLVRSELTNTSGRESNRRRRIQTSSKSQSLKPARLS